MKLVSQGEGRKPPSSQTSPTNDLRASSLTLVPASGTYFTTREAAEYLRMSERWVQGETAAGRLACVRYGPKESRKRPVRYMRADLDAYVAACRGESD